MAKAEIDLPLLRVLVALLDAGSVSRAALQLGISQSAASGALAKLRQHFGEPLFVRATGGMAPTPLGAEMAGVARELLLGIEQKLRPRDRFDPASAHPPFTFALSDVGEIVFLPRLLAACAKASPDTPLRSVSLRPAPLAEALESGDVDLAIGYFPDLKPSRFLQQKLLTHRFLCLLRADHPVQGNRLTMGEFLSLRHAVVQSEGRSQELLERFLDARSLHRRIALYTPHFLSIPKLIAQSDMVVTVPHAIGICYGTPAYGLKAIKPPFETPPIELRQHWHRKVHKDARNLWLRELVGSLFNPRNDEW